MDIKRITLNNFLNINFSNINKIYFKYFSSNFLYQLIPVLTIPFLSRIYSPENIASYSLILGISIIAAQLSTLGLQNVILIERRSNKFSIFIFLPLIISFSINLLLFLFIKLAKNFFLLDVYGVEIYIDIIPFISFLYSVYLILKTVFIRTNELSYIALSRIIYSFSLPSFSLIFGLLNFGIKGLIISLFLSNFFNTSSIISLNFIDIVAFTIDSVIFGLSPSVLKDTHPFVFSGGDSFDALGGEAGSP